MYICNPNQIHCNRHRPTSHTICVIVLRLKCWLCRTNAKASKGTQSAKRWHCDRRIRFDKIRDERKKNYWNLARKYFKIICYARPAPSKNSQKHISPFRRNNADFVQYGLLFSTLLLVQLKFVGWRDHFFFQVITLKLWIGLSFFFVQKFVFFSSASMWRTQFFDRNVEKLGRRKFIVTEKLTLIRFMCRLDWKFVCVAAQFKCFIV